jgi:hypothetical protein
MRSDRSSGGLLDLPARLLVDLLHRNRGFLGPWEPRREPGSAQVGPSRIDAGPAHPALTFRFGRGTFSCRAPVVCAALDLSGGIDGAVSDSAPSSTAGVGG